jgi:hypothetical protein
MEQHSSQSNTHFRQFFDLFLRIWILYPDRKKFISNDTAIGSKFQANIDSLSARIYTPPGFNGWKTFTQIEEIRTKFGVEYNELKAVVKASGISIAGFESAFILEFMVLNLGDVIDALMHGPMALEAI